MERFAVSSVIPLILLSKAQHLKALKLEFHFLFDGGLTSCMMARVVDRPFLRSRQRNRARTSPDLHPASSKTSGFKGWSKMRYVLTIRLHAVACLLFAASAGAQIVVTGDSRIVTEPVIPPVCTQLFAAITQVNNDIPTSVDATNTNPDAARIQMALNNCSASSPGQAVELSIDPTGVFNAFLSGPLVMPPNITLLVDPGVTLFFSRNAQDFDLVPGTHTCGTRNGNSANKSCKPPIDIPAASTNVGIMGYGKLNARGGDPLLNGFATSGFAPPATYTWWNLAGLTDQQVPESMIQPESGVTDLTLYKITLQNASMFHVKSIGTIKGLTAWGVKIETPTFTNNTDGIDPDQAQNVTVANSWISDGDDDIAVGSSGSPGSTNGAANISIINNHFFAGHGESIGSFTDGGVNNVFFDKNMLAGDDFSGKGSAINAVPFTINTTTYPVNYADGNSVAIRIKSDQAAGGLVTNVQYSNSCFLDHRKDLLFTPLYNTDTGSNTPNVYGILLQNLAFLNDAGSTGTVQFTGTNTVVGGVTIINPLQVTLDNVTFPSTLTASQFTNTGTSGTEQYAELTYGPGDVSANFISAFATFVAVPSNHDTVTNNITATSLNPSTCNFTYIAPELTGPNNLPQTITYGQTATAVVILTPAVALAAYPTGTVTLTDSLTGNTTQATLSGTGDTLFVPLTGLGVGTHVFTATWPGDSNYVPAAGQTIYSTAGPYVVTVNPATLTVTANNATRSVGAANPTFTASYSGFVTGEGTAVLSGSPSLSTTATTSSPAGVYPITVTQATLSSPNYTFAFDNGILSVVAPPSAVISTSATLTAITGGYQAIIKVTNSGTGDATNLSLNTATLGSAAGSTLPQSIGTLAAGTSTTFTVTFPSSAGAPGSGVSEKYSGTYTGGSFAASVRSVILPGTI
jgi:polygalacturonase